MLSHYASDRKTLLFPICLLSFFIFLTGGDAENRQKKEDVCEHVHSTYTQTHRCEQGNACLSENRIHARQCGSDPLAWRMLIHTAFSILQER